MMMLAYTLVELSIVYSLLVVAILALRSGIRRLCGARWAYALWLILIVPVVVKILPNSLISSVAPHTAPVVSLPQIEHATSIGYMVSSAAIISWLAVAAVLMLQSYMDARQLTRRLRTSCMPMSGEQERLIGKYCAQVNVFPSPVVQFSSDVTGPAVLGLVSPMLLLPAHFFQKFTPAEQSLMIRHELTHIQRKDGWCNALICVFRCLFWFNPLVHWAERRFRVDQELSCDQSVLWDEQVSERAAYAMSILKVASPAGGTHLIEFRSTGLEILGRTELLSQHRRTVAQSISGYTILLFALACTVIVAAPAQGGIDNAAVSTGWCAAYRSLRRAS